MPRGSSTPQLPVLPADRKYVVIGPYVWGADPDFTVALKNAKKQFGSGRGWKYIVYNAHANVRIDDMGGFVWVPAEVGQDGSMYAPNPYHEVLRVGFPPVKGGA